MKKKVLLILGLFLLSLLCISCKKESSKKTGKEEAQTENKEKHEEKSNNEISGPVWADEDKKYVYFGAFPQREMVGDDLTEEIREASYDEKGFAEVEGNTYICLNGSDVFYNYYLENGSVSEHYYDWSDGQSHYFLCEPILWRVLENEDGRVLLFSEFALGAQPFDIAGREVIRWNESTLRSWLNSYGSENNAEGYDFSSSDAGFYHQAFSEEEQSKIQKTALKNKENAHYPVEGSEDTEDYIFLLAEDEVEQYFTLETRNGVVEPRAAFATDYAKAMGAYVDYIEGVPYTYWWTRSIGGEENSIVCIDSTGLTYYLGDYADMTGRTYRPALYLEETAITEPESYAPVRTKYTEPILQNGGVALASLQSSGTSSTGMSEITSQIDDWGYGCVRALKLTRGALDDKECFVEYELSESYERFVALVSYSSDRLADEDLILRIFADNKELYVSESIYSLNKPLELELSLDGAKKIRFVWEGEAEPGSEEAGGAILLSDAYFLPEQKEASEAEVAEVNTKAPAKKSNGGTIVIIILIVILLGAVGFLTIKAVKKPKTASFGQKESTVTYLHEMNVLQADNYYNYSDEAQDTAGTDYSGVANFFVWNPGAGKNGSVFYQTDCSYAALTLYVAPWKGFSPTAISQFVVYVNNETRYVSPEITFETPFFEINVDIRDAQTICLCIVSNEENGTLLLSEMKLIK